MPFPVIKAYSACLFHLPSQVRYGSKPIRELSESGPWTLDTFFRGLRSYNDALGYAPNQVFIGNMKPDDLANIKTPWFSANLQPAPKGGPFGEIVSERAFFTLLKISDQFNLIFLEDRFAAEAASSLVGHPLIQPEELEKAAIGVPRAEIDRLIQSGALPLWVDCDHLIGCVLNAHDQDESLTARIYLENLACKASGMWALRSVLNRGTDVNPEQIDYILGCGEEAVGDRYQRGGGGMAKAFGEMAGCVNANGADIKVFCCSPVHAVITAAAYVKAGLFQQVAVVGGGAFSKLGMKFQGHLNKSMPILEDVIGSIAVVVGESDGVSPQIRLDAVGKHNIGLDPKPQTMAEVLACNPIDRIGLHMTDIDKYAPELHNPEITEPVGSGNVPRINYQILGYLAAKRGEISQSEIEMFVKKHGMPGYAPTQGHIPSAIAYMGHAVEGIRQGFMKRVLFMAKGSLFLGRMTNLSDGMSFILDSTDDISR